MRNGGLDMSLPPSFKNPRSLTSAQSVAGVNTIWQGCSDGPWPMCMCYALCVRADTMHGASDVRLYTSFANKAITREEAPVGCSLLMGAISGRKKVNLEGNVPTRLKIHVR